MTAQTQPVSCSEPGITPRRAKQLIRAALNKLGLGCERLIGRTIDFTDLARCRRVFVQVHGWQPNPAWADLQAVAQQNGFYIEAR